MTAPQVSLWHYAHSWFDQTVQCASSVPRSRQHRNPRTRLPKTIYGHNGHSMVNPLKQEIRKRSSSASTVPWGPKTIDNSELSLGVSGVNFRKWWKSNKRELRICRFVVVHFPNSRHCDNWSLKF
ncbi:hypothetical protein ACOME3_002600 [Neoechinorhynchus agilis]